MSVRPRTTSLQRIVAFIALVVLLIGGLLPTCSADPIAFPKIDRHPAPWDLHRGFRESVPKYDPANNSPFQVDLRGYNLSRLDLREAGAILQHAIFDDKTIWPAPDRLPTDFDRARLVELGKNPGLGVRSLHAQGITGRGVGIAIVDNPLLTDHQEYAERLRLYEEKNVTASQGEFRWTPLHGACGHGHTEVVELLIQNGAKVDAKASEGSTKRDYTPLNCAVANEHYQAARILVAHGADVTFTPQGDRPPLYYVLLGNDKDLVEILISKGSRAPALHLAAFRGDLANVKSLCAAGTEVDARDEAKWTPLHWAVAGGQRDIAEFLISKGADVNAKGLFDETPLHVAAYTAAGSKESVELLLSHGVNVNAVTVRGNRPLHYAARRSVPIVEVLLAHGADIDVKNQDGKTPLYLSVEKGNKEASEFLLAKGADIEAKENYNRTPLHEACRTGQKDLVELLLAKGADINARDKYQRTPMSMAENGGHRQIVDLLRGQGVKE